MPRSRIHNTEDLSKVFHGQLVHSVCCLITWIGYLHETLPATCIWWSGHPILKIDPLYIFLVQSSIILDFPSLPVYTS